MACTVSLLMLSAFASAVTKYGDREVYKDWMVLAHGSRDWELQESIIGIRLASGQFSYMIAWWRVSHVSLLIKPLMLSSYLHTI